MTIISQPLEVVDEDWDLGDPVAQLHTYLF